MLASYLACESRDFDTFCARWPYPYNKFLFSCGNTALSMTTAFAFPPSTIFVSPGKDSVRFKITYVTTYHVRLRLSDPVAE